MSGGTSNMGKAAFESRKIRVGAKKPEKIFSGNGKEDIQ